MKQDELPVKWVGHVSTQSLSCNSGKWNEVEGLKKREGGKKRREERNQYFHKVATPATANDSKHHEKIWEQGRGKK